MATPGEMVERLEHAIAAKPGRQRCVMEIGVPTLLGESGRYLGHDEHGPLYGYRRRQCKRMLLVIRRAVLADMAAEQ